MGVQGTWELCFASKEGSLLGSPCVGELGEKPRTGQAAACSPCLPCGDAPSAVPPGSRAPEDAASGGRDRKAVLARSSV